MSVHDAVRELLVAQGREVTSEDLGLVDNQLARLTDQQAGLMTRQWRETHPEEEPQFEDLLRIQRRAAMTADEMLTAQYREELLMVTDEEATDEPTPPDVRPLSQRWVEDLEYVEASDESLSLVESLWSQQTPRWIVLAGSLIEVWSQEGRRLPQTIEDADARQVEELVDARIAAGDALLS